MSETDPAAPLAVLDTMLSKPVTVRTKAGQRVRGTLAGYDEHLNLTLEAGPATDDRDTDEPRLLRGNRVVSITHPPIDRESANGLSTAPNSQTDREPPSRATDASNETPSPALAALKDQLESENLAIDIGAAGETLLVTKLGQEYRIYPDGTVEGDGLHRKHLEQFLTD